MTQIKTSISPVRKNTTSGIKVYTCKRSSLTLYNELKSNIILKKNYFALKMACKLSVSDKKKDPVSERQTSELEILAHLKT